MMDSVLTAVIGFAAFMAGWYGRRAATDILKKPDKKK